MAHMAVVAPVLPYHVRDDTAGIAAIFAVKNGVPSFLTANLLTPPTCKSTSNDAEADALSVMFSVNAEKVTDALFHVCVIVLGVLAEIVPAANVAVVSVGAVDNTTEPVPVVEAKLGLG